MFHLILGPCKCTSKSSEVSAGNPLFCHWWNSHCSMFMIDTCLSEKEFRCQSVYSHFTPWEVKTAAHWPIRYTIPYISVCRRSLSESLIKGELFNKKVSKRSPQFENYQNKWPGIQSLSTDYPGGTLQKHYWQLRSQLQEFLTASSWKPSSPNSGGSSIDHTPVEAAIPTERKKEKSRRFWKMNKSFIQKDNASRI